MYNEHCIYTQLAVEESNFGPMPWQVKLKQVSINTMKEKIEMGSRKADLCNMVYTK